MTTPNSFILIKGEPKALQIETIYLGDNGTYKIKFKSSANTYHFRYIDVVWLKDATWHDCLNCKVFIGEKEIKNVSDIRSFQQDSLTHWRITFDNGFVQDYKHGTIQVVESCLADEIAKNSFEYLKRVAQINELGKDEECGGILPSLYEKVSFVDKTLAAAPYLNPKKYKVRKLKSTSLIFPFGCNASQEKAVTAAFEKQLSIIQGPPGTGKTQTILNIIANILLQGKTVIVVSNNNSATINVKEKLEKYGFGFVVAALGKHENKENFLRNQPTLSSELRTWQIESADCNTKKQLASATLKELRKVFRLQEELALAKQEIKAVELEWSHFKQDNNVSDDSYEVRKNIKSEKLMSLWLWYQTCLEHHNESLSLIEMLKEKIKNWWMNFTCKHSIGIKSSPSFSNIQPLILELQSLYYLMKMNELRIQIENLETELSFSDAKTLNSKLTFASLEILKNALYDKYFGKERFVFSDVRELSKKAGYLLKQYPVVLSTTFSARTTLSDTVVYDYLIMDEASQVSIETGALALTCAKNAVIVGDTFQLPNVVTADDKLKLDAIFNEYKVSPGYNSSDYSFLQSVCTVVPDVCQTLLREHYRCHPKIINFCNQKFYGGNLLIMTDDRGEENVLSAVKTVPGDHCRGHYNQREIDVVKQEVLDNLPADCDVGIITPYNAQVDAFNRQIPNVETATIHKYQGREKDVIVMSTVDDQITEFSDDPNLLNVAVSRAKRKFCLVVSGNEQKLKGNISDLIDYIEYNNFTVSESRICSIFDYLYSQYTDKRINFLANSKKISEYDSENLTYKLLTYILAKYPEYNHLGVFCHTPIRNVIRDWSLMNEDEKRYVSHYSTHLDFLIVNHVTKKPVLAIETDGYNYHDDETQQHERDIMKDHILTVYELPLLRLSTIGSGEYDKIVTALNSILKA